MAVVHTSGISIYGRTVLHEGQVPDFDGDFRDEIDEMILYAGIRLFGLGLMFGSPQGAQENDFDLYPGFTLSAD